MLLAGTGAPTTAGSREKIVANVKARVESRIFMLLYALYDVVVQQGFRSGVLAGVEMETMQSVLARGSTGRRVEGVSEQKQVVISPFRS